MSDWLSPQGLITVVIGFTLLEGMALWMYRWRTGKGVAARDFVANWMSGLCLMFALRSALTGTWWAWVALWLLAAGLIHASDVWSRWQR
ncbi:MAG: hypothetical protein K2Q07_09190 [Burkholderiaceae bacterium]|nr:hypothetical protein [Burkholderiaceae bacterium]